MTTLIANGSLSLAGTTETEFEAARTAANTYQLVVDTAAMVAGDAFELVIYSKTRTADPERRRWTVQLDGVQGDPIKQLIPIPTDCHFRATLRRTGGSGTRAFPWALLAL